MFIIYSECTKYANKWGYLRIKFRHKFVGKEKLKECKNQGYFMYANHTQPFADTFIPSVADYPKRNFLIVNPVNISLRGTGTLVEMLGAIPIPSGIKAIGPYIYNATHMITIPKMTLGMIFLISFPPAFSVVSQFLCFKCISFLHIMHEEMIKIDLIFLIY